MKKTSRYMDTGLILAGAVFLISPMITVLDILPDFIGYALIMRGLYRLADMTEHMEDAYRLCRKLMLTGVARMGCILFAFGFVSQNEQPTALLLCSFVLAVIDCMFLIPAWKKMSEGILYLSTRHEGTAAFHSRKKEKAHKRPPIRSPRNVTEKLLSHTLIFLVAREVLSTLPEFSVLVHEKGGAEHVTRWSFLYDHIGLLRGVCAVIVLIMGIVWFVHVLYYARHLSKDVPFFVRLNERYAANVLTRPELFAKRAVKRAMIFMCVAFCLSIDFFLDDICITPDFLLAGLLVVGLLILRKHISGVKVVSAVVASVLTGVVSAVQWGMEWRYFVLSDALYVYRDAVLYDHWVVMCMITVVVQILFLITLFLTVRTLGEVIRRYTGLSVSGHDSANPTAHVRSVHRELERGLWIAFGGGVVVAGSAVIFMVTLPISYDTLWEIWRVVEPTVNIIFPAIFIWATQQIFEQIEYKYLLS